MKGTKPTKILVGGDKSAAQNFIGAAESQMEILKKQMSFQNRFQGVRRVWLYSDVYVECVKCFNYQETRIWVKPIPYEEKQKEKNILAVIVSTYSDEKAFAWDLLSNTLLFPVDTFDQISENMKDYSSLIQLESDGEWVLEATGSVVEPQPGNLPTSIFKYFWSIWETTGMNEYAICPFNPNIEDWDQDAWAKAWEDGRPNGDFAGAYFTIYPHAFYPLGDDPEDKWQVGDSIVFSTERGSFDVNFISKNSGGGFDTNEITGDYLSSITEIWTIQITQGAVTGVNKKAIHISGESVGDVYDSGAGPIAQCVWTDFNPGETYIPWRIFKPVEIVEYIENPEGGEESRCSNYFFKTSDGFKGTFWKDDFYSLTGHVWPIDEEPEDKNFVMRERFFYNPVFGNNFQWLGKIHYAGMMKALTFSLYDSWIDGDWSEPGRVQQSDEGEPGDIIDDPRYAHNRCDGIKLIGRAPSYEKVNSEDNTLVVGNVVFDAYRFCSYVGQCEENMQFSIAFFYKQDNTLTGIAKEAFDLVNDKRGNYGLPPLVFNPFLQKAAERHALDIATNQLYNNEDPHEGSDGSLWYERTEDAGYCYYWSITTVFNGENMGVISMPFYNTEHMVSEWMGSPLHKENIIHEEYTETGMAVVMEEGTDHYCFCQVFGGKKGVWPGYVPFDVEDLNNYMEEVFDYNDIIEDDEFLKVYTTQKISKDER